MAGQEATHANWGEALERPHRHHWLAGGSLEGQGTTGMRFCWLRISPLVLSESDIGGIRSESKQSDMCCYNYES